MALSTDTTTTLHDIKLAMHQFATDRDWLQFHDPKNLAMGLAIEAAELMEHFQWTDNRSALASLDDPKKKQAFREELADVLLYLAELANVTHTDLASAVAEKLALNARKYPVEKSKGVATKYTDL